ncbi:MAG: Gfo/Idh/MocA family oxidoreductase [Planctomycetota bacterium]
MSDQARRNFLKTTASLAAVGVATAATSKTAAAASTGSRLRIGFIGVGGRAQKHISSLLTLRNEAGRAIDLVAVCDVYSIANSSSAAKIEKATEARPAEYVDYREMIAKEDLDAVVISTPDHWHHRHIVDSLNAGLHVYAEKPMTKTVEQAIDVADTWEGSGKVMQVGVQSTSLPVWDEARARIQNGQLGKVLGYQTEFFRNSSMGQWRYYKLDAKMTPKTVDWDRFLGVEEGLAEPQPFDRAAYAQWRRFWQFGSGMFSDLFVHRTTSMLKATGLRYPRRVVGAGGIFLEYDGRDVPDVATVVADFDEGVQGLVTATMANQNSRIPQCIRGHHGSFVFGNGEKFDSFDFVAERPQVTLNSSIKDEKIATEKIRDTTLAHHANFLDAVEADDPSLVNNPPDLGAAAIAVVLLGAKSYREGRYLQLDGKQIVDADSSWAEKWEAKSESRDLPNHVAGWKAGTKGSTLVEPDYQKLEGPWIDGKDPASV